MTGLTSMVLSTMTNNTLNLRQFMLRQQVLKLYRDILRSIYKVDDLGYRKELLQWARHDFQKQRHLEDEEAIKMMLSMGQRHLRELQNTVNLAR